MNSCHFPTQSLITTATNNIHIEIFIQGVHLANHDEITDIAVPTMSLLHITSKN